jgi:hypothetical protein
MSHKLILTFFLLYLITGSGCISTKKMRGENRSEMFNISKASLDGLYSNKEVSAEGWNYWQGLGLLEALNRNYSGKLKDSIINDTSYVKLELLNENLLNVKYLTKNYSVVGEFNLKGKIENKYFSVERKFFLLPIPFLFFYYETKNLIGTSSDSNLVVMHGSKDFVWLLVMAGGSEGDGISRMQFEKIRN